MLVRLIEKHSDVVKSWSIKDFDQSGGNIRFRGEIKLIDNSIISIRQVVLNTGVFKYAYHWQDSYDFLICRWDNAPHWPNIASYPHHKHIMIRNKIIVKESQGGDLEEVFDEIASIVRSKIFV